MMEKRKLAPTLGDRLGKSSTETHGLTGPSAGAGRSVGSTLVRQDQRRNQAAGQNPIKAGF